MRAANCARGQGSTSGIGLAIARTLAAGGAKIVLNGFGAPADIERTRVDIEKTFKVWRARARSDAQGGACGLGVFQLARHTLLGQVRVPPGRSYQTRRYQG